MTFDDKPWSKGVSMPACRCSLLRRFGRTFQNCIGCGDCNGGHISGVDGRSGRFGSCRFDGGGSVCGYQFEQGLIRAVGKPRGGGGVEMGCPEEQGTSASS